jgi:hypothetical protein
VRLKKQGSENLGGAGTCVSTGMSFDRVQAPPPPMQRFIRWRRDLLSRSTSLASLSVPATLLYPATWRMVDCTLKLPKHPSTPRSRLAV